VAESDDVFLLLLSPARVARSKSLLDFGRPLFLNNNNTQS